MTQTNVPYVALALRARRVKSELMAAIERVIDHGIYILGPEVEEFERRFAAYCGTRYAVGVADGTSALILALRAVGVGPGDEVITAPNSFAASASSAALLGATPRFVDVRREDLNMDPALLEAAITPRTKAIVPVHLTVHPADMEAIVKIADRHGIPVIEDAAQSVGTLYHGRKTGSIGQLGCSACIHSRTCTPSGMPASSRPTTSRCTAGCSRRATTGSRAGTKWSSGARTRGSTRCMPPS